MDCGIFFYVKALSLPSVEIADQTEKISFRIELWYDAAGNDSGTYLFFFCVSAALSDAKYVRIRHAYLFEVEETEPMPHGSRMMADCFSELIRQTIESCNEGSRHELVRCPDDTVLRNLVERALWSCAN